MAIAKSLSQAPVGLEMLNDQPDLEIEIENPEQVTLDDGSVEITLIPGSKAEDGTEFDANLAEHMGEGELQSLASELINMVEADIASRRDWAETFVKGLEVIGMKLEERTEPWEGACNVQSTVLAEAAIRFQAETIMETFPAAGPVKTAIIGETNKLKEEAAARVKDDMNYQLTEVMSEYRPDHERMLYSLGLAGSAFKKVYFDPHLDRQASVYIPAEDVIVPYGASTIERAERVTHIMRKTPNEMKRLQVSGFYRDVDLGDPITFASDIEKKKAEDGGYTLTDDERYAIYEIHVDYNLPGFEDEDEIALPYVIAIERGTQTILSIRRNWDPDDKRMLKRQHFVHYIYIPGFGFYGMGLIHIIGGYARAGTSIIRQLVDSGTLANLPGGVKSKGLRIKGDDTPIAPGEFRDVDVPSGTIRDNILPLPYKEPSQVLLALLNQITEEGRRLGAVSDINISDMSANAPVGTTLALLERTLKTMSAVQARVHASMKQEFKLLKNIIAEFAPGEYDYMPENSDRKARKTDYALVEVIPVSDPNSTTMAQRVLQYQAVQQLSTTAPQIYNLPFLHRQMIEVLGVKNADRIVPTEDDQKPRDPISENMSFLNAKPVKAFIYQDHQAHIAAHQAFMQDPMIAQTIGQNPMAQTMAASISAHIAEHLAFAYRRQVEEQMGVPLPNPDQDLPEDMEVEISRLVAQASQQLLQEHQAQAQQAQAQQQAQDPLIQMQQAELQIKSQDAATKAKKVDADIELNRKKLDLEAMKVLQLQNAGQAELALQTQQTEQEAQAHQMQLQQQAAQHQQSLQQAAQVHAQQLQQKQQQAEQQAAIQAQQAAQKAAQQPPSGAQ